MSARDRSDAPRTRLATSSPDDVTVRGASLTRDLVGTLSFTEMMYFEVTGRRPTPSQTRAVDACLVTLVEHGHTPSSIATRMVYASAPEAMQGAVAAGLLAVGSVFVGTVEGCARLLARIATAHELDEEARRVVEEHHEAKLRIPGFGHPEHRPDDPRSVVLFEIARREGVAGPHVAALEALGRAVDAAAEKHVTINATGAFAAVMADAGVPIDILRGFALVARAAGLVAHVREEQRDPAMKTMWEAARAAVPYEEAPEEDPEEGGQNR